MFIKTEQQAVQNLKSHPDEVFVFLYKKCYSIVKRHIKNNSGSSDDALDIFQDALLILHSKTRTEHGFDFNNNVSAYTILVCKNLWLQRLERIRRERKSLNEANSPISQTSLEVNNEEFFNPLPAKSLSDYLTALGDKCKELLEAFYFLELNMKEIQERFSYSSEHSAANQKYKCMERLKKQIPSNILEQYLNEGI